MCKKIKHFLIIIHYVFERTFQKRQITEELLHANKTEHREIKHKPLFLIFRDSPLIMKQALAHVSETRFLSHLPCYE